MGRRDLRTYLLTQDDDSAISLDESFLSKETNVDGLDRFSYQISWDGTTVDGVFTIEVSLGRAGQDLTLPDPIWSTVDFGGVDIVADTDTGDHFIEIVQTGAKLSRLRYTRTTGTGTMTAVIGGTVNGS